MGLAKRGFQRFWDRVLERFLELSREGSVKFGLQETFGGCLWNPLWRSSLELRSGSFEFGGSVETSVEVDLEVDFGAQSVEPLST